MNVSTETRPSRVRGPSTEPTIAPTAEGPPRPAAPGPAVTGIIARAGAPVERITGALLGVFAAAYLATGLVGVLNMWHGVTSSAVPPANRILDGALLGLDAGLAVALAGGVLLVAGIRLRFVLPVGFLIAAAAAMTAAGAATNWLGEWFDQSASELILGIGLAVLAGATAVLIRPRAHPLRGNAPAERVAGALLGLVAATFLASGLMGVLNMWHVVTTAGLATTGARIYLGSLLGQDAGFAVALLGALVIVARTRPRLVLPLGFLVVAVACFVGAGGLVNAVGGWSDQSTQQLVLGIGMAVLAGATAVMIRARDGRTSARPATPGGEAHR